MPVRIPYSVAKLRLFLRSYYVVEILIILSSYSSPQPYEMVVINVILRINKWSGSMPRACIKLKS